MPLIVDSNSNMSGLFVRYKTKTLQRKFISHFAQIWLRFQHARGVTGAIMVDIDDTLININENVTNGFEYMKTLYDEMVLVFPVHIVTARPLEDHARVMTMLTNNGFHIPTDRLHMLPTHLYYDSDTSQVAKWKWETYKEIKRRHKTVVARFGDRLWDVANYRSLNTSLKHVKHSDCYVFMDASQNGTASFKLPGNGD